MCRRSTRSVRCLSRSRPSLADALTYAPGAGVWAVSTARGGGCARRVIDLGTFGELTIGQRMSPASQGRGRRCLRRHRELQSPVSWPGTGAPPSTLTVNGCLGNGPKCQESAAEWPGPAGVAARVALSGGGGRWRRRRPGTARGICVLRRLFTLPEFVTVLRGSDERCGFGIAMFNFLAFIVVILRQERQASKLESVERSTNGLVDKIIQAPINRRHRTRRDPRSGTGRKNPHHQQGADSWRDGNERIANWARSLAARNSSRASLSLNSRIGGWRIMLNARTIFRTSRRNGSQASSSTNCRNIGVCVSTAQPDGNTQQGDCVHRVDNAQDWADGPATDTENANSRQRR